MLLQYDKPASSWMTEALPLGNGTLGAMFFGGVSQERLQFNEKTLWTGSSALRGAYQNFGDLYFEFPSHTGYTEYRRELSLDDAIGSVSYVSGNAAYAREYFVSYPAQAIIMRFTAPGNPERLSFSVRISDSRGGVPSIAGNRMSIQGTLDLLSYCAILAVLPEDGTLEAENGRLYSRGASAVTVLLAGGTNFSILPDAYIGETPSDLRKRLSAALDRAALQPYTELKREHLRDYKPLFSRVCLDLDAETPRIPTDRLIRQYRENPYLDILHFQYGRYLLLSSSRGISLPNNLQGIWNDSNDPPWQCDIHSNINIEMNYWCAESANLPECHLPFLTYIRIEALRGQGAWRTAAASLGREGWTLKTQCNIFGYTDWHWNRPANAWYCMHIWGHYAYSQDRAFLREYFPVMRKACEFWMNRLVLNSEGRLEAPDEWSPEQGDWENGVPYAQQLIWELFADTRKAAEILETDPQFRAELTAFLRKLDNGVAVGSWGQIKEWKTDASGLDKPANKHRHLSHLIALYPGNQISYHADPALASGARVSLEARGDAGTGWSRAWKILCWSRLFDGERAYRLLKAAQECTDITETGFLNGGGVYDNLLSAHPPFQIDGNFGVTAGIAEMLLQSNRGFIQLLPALPSAWRRGAFSGLRAEGNFTVSLSWDNGAPVEGTVHSGSGKPCTLYYPGLKTARITAEDGTAIPFAPSHNAVTFETQAAKTYFFFF
ncbi:MAG: glycoside hydrolase family 95 protein [Spirochaetaceae bacterium]|jgi:alpha-L-fucosidase 2|nr:glycoside hydrolase family 95 protein [Spirochaetaceae bacterium]